MSETETYLKTQQVAWALGVSVSTIKRWVDEGSIEATRTMGKHRRVPLSSALKFARREELPVDRLLDLTDRPPVEKIDDRVCEGLLDALRRGQVREASDLIDSVYRSDRGAVGLADDLLRPVMQQVGHGWMVGDWDVYQEHQASRIVATALVDLIAREARASTDARPLALGASPEGDFYNLPGLLGELVLREVGWDVRLLGNNLPLRSLARATRDYRPGLVFLSASHLVDRGRFLQEYAYFYEAAHQAGSAIVIGGRALDAALRSKLVYASYGDRMAHLAEFARHLLAHPGPARPASAGPAGPMNTST